jgi:hypothetical protein
MSKPNRRLLERYQLLRFVIHAEWATSLDARVMSVLVEEWRHYKGLVSISARQLVDATGYKRRNEIIASIHRLIERGVIQIARQGSGTRAAEYELCFDIVAVEETSTAIHDDNPLAVEETSTSEVEETSTAKDASGRGNLYQPPISSRVLPGKRESVQYPPPARRQEAARGGKKAFDALLALYRRPHGEDVPAASQAYLDALAAGHGHDTVLAGASAWVGAVEARYLPKLERFLRDGLFLNGPPTGSKAANGHSRRRGKVDVVRAALEYGGYHQSEDGTLTLEEGGR